MLNQKETETTTIREALDPSDLDTRRLLSRKQGQRFINIGSTKYKELCALGEIVEIVVDGRHKVQLSELLRFVESRRSRIPTEAS
jgi:hypothetical protein